MNDGASSPSDHLYTEKLATVKDFTFNEAVTQVFNDMVRRSVPGYEAVVELVGVIAAAHSRTIGRPLRCLDLGCSRGAITQSLLNQLADPATQIVAIDNSETMISAAQKEIDDERVTFIAQDILQSDFEGVDVVVMNLVLQFLDPSERENMLSRIRRGLRADGLFILTEKIHADAEFVDYHHAFKRSKGYSELEITQKRDALERVMVIDSLETHKKRLKRCRIQSSNRLVSVTQLGFAHCETMSFKDWLESSWKSAGFAINTTDLAHGKLKSWLATFKRLPQIQPELVRLGDTIKVGTSNELSTDEGEILDRAIVDLMPWRKGPLNLFGREIDAEWRSDFKWNRLAAHVQWQSKKVLDIGSGNGYFGFRAIEAGAKSVLGVDGYEIYVLQAALVNWFVRSPNVVVPLRFNRDSVQGRI